MSTEETILPMTEGGVEPVVPPEDEVYWTCNQALSYIASLDQEIQDRFANLQTRSGITIPATDDALRTAQLELIMAAI